MTNRVPNIRFPNPTESVLNPSHLPEAQPLPLQRTALLGNKSNVVNPIQAIVPRNIQPATTPFVPQTFNNYSQDHQPKKTPSILRIFDDPGKRSVDDPLLSNRVQRNPYESLPDEELNRILSQLESEISQAKDKIELLEQNARLIEFNVQDNKNQIETIKIRNLEDQIRKVKQDNHRLKKEKDEFNSKIEALDKDYSMKTYNQRLKLEENSRKVMEHMELKIALENGNDQNKEIAKLKAQVREAMSRIGMTI